MSGGLQPDCTYVHDTTNGAWQAHCDTRENTELCFSANVTNLVGLKSARTACLQFWLESRYGVRMNPRCSWWAMTSG